MDGSGEPSNGGRRLLVLGLDGVPPEFLFDRLLPAMPNVRALVERGLRAPLRTTDPPISVPAWPVMFTGVDPGTLGLYGFRHRRRSSYTEMYLPVSSHLPVPTIWELLSQRGRRVAVIGMPLGYPAPEVNGIYISDFLTPPGGDHTTTPASLRAEIEAQFGPYVFDVSFRTGDRDRIAREIFEMTKRRFDVAESLYRREPWDVFALHEVGTDRLHHAFWKQFDREHPGFVPGNPHENVADAYYALLDERIGRLIAAADDRTDVVIVSDHGSMAMRGCFCINQWLEDRGYLVLNHPPPAPGTPLEKVDVDWSRTTVWGAGGYYARLFFNVQGREPLGLLTMEQATELRQTIAEELRATVGPDGAPMRVEILDPRELYRTVVGDAPDLMVYFDDLRIRSAGTMGHPSLFLTENDSGPDDAVHSPYGVFLFAPGGGEDGRELAPFPVIDVAPTLLARLEEPIPEHVQGHVIPDVVRAGSDPAPLPGA